jgi:hyperosmotically inducible periplasmic protein
MNDTFPRLGIVALLALAALLAAGCEQHNDANPIGRWQGTLASVAARDDAEAPGTDEAVEDLELTTRVREAILADPQLQSQHIDVETEDSAVRLTGTVDSPALRERAVQLAGSVIGVVQVQEKLEVRS